jgi:CheY-like chemotaxis protein
MIRVLWADDQLDVARTLSSSLAQLTRKVRFAADGAEALELLAVEYYDVAIVDLLMPPGTWGGLWLLEKLKSTNTKVPVIVLSGEGTQTETIKALRLGASDYVTKDNAERELAECVQRVLGRSWQDVQMAISAVFPTPIAVPYTRYQAAGATMSRLRRLVEVFEHVLRFTCFVGLVDLEFSSAPDKDIRSAFFPLARPSMGSWNQLRRMLSTKVDRQREFHTFSRALDSADVGPVIELRNDLAHGGDPSEGRAHDLLTGLETRSERLFKVLWQGMSTKLVVVENMKFSSGRFEISGAALSGDSFALPRYEMQLNQAVESDQVYLVECKIQNATNLDPYIVAEPGEDPALWRVLIFDGWTGYAKSFSGSEAIKYLDLQSGSRSVTPHRVKTLAKIPEAFWKARS